jgi:hypothetical protein
VIKGITSWANARIVLGRRTAHIYWFHGFAGSGKSAISLEIARIYASSGRLLASYFFFRNAGDRSRMNRFVMTLASQLAAVVPAAAPFIEAAMKAEPGLLTDKVSLSTQLEQLVYGPFQAAMKGPLFVKTLATGPFLIVIDGLDECEDKRGVEEFLTHALDFFKRHPSIPLRIFIASRVEQHIHAHIKHDEGVVVRNLSDHSPDDDVRRFLEGSFQIAAKQNPVIQAYIHAHGSWPTPSDMGKLIVHVGGSFILASTIFKFIVQQPTEEDFMTPMDRLPLTLEMNGLDSLYTQTLSRSQHLPHFRVTISTIAFIFRPLSIVDISALLGIEVFEVVRVLLNLQAIIRVPGTDEQGVVTLSHKSLLDFLTTESRSGSLFVPPSFHLCLAYYCFSWNCEESNDSARLPASSRFHKPYWESFATSGASDLINEIERFKACPPLRDGGMPYPAFFCTVFFYALFVGKPYPSNDASYLFTGCAKQLALAAECPDPLLQIEGWLRNSTFMYLRDKIHRDIPSFTEDTCKTLQHHLQRASTAIYANVRFRFTYLHSCPVIFVDHAHSFLDS